jgi:uncharacterized membrane protein HdeD (DUF308 family)
MKEVEVLIGIILIICGAILFEMNKGTLTTVIGILLISTGVIFYIRSVDTLDKTKEKRE